MSKAMYPVVGGTAHAGKAGYAVLSGLTRKIKAGYAVRGGVHRQFFSAGPQVSFTGTHTITDVTVGGVACKLYTLTGSGTLTVEGGEAQYWMCGGGSSGESGKYTFNSADNLKTCSAGCGGSGGHISSGLIAAGTWIISIGAGGGTAATGTTIRSNDGGQTTVVFNSTTHTAAGGTLASGGSGGGSGRYASNRGSSFRSAGTGDGVSTIPFGLQDILGTLAAGGGGGGLYASISSSVTYKYSGGNGGSNGGNGSNGTASSVSGGTGGADGGGDGGTATNYPLTKVNGADGIYPGSGGGGGAVYYSSCGTGGAGYQGVAYVLVPAA